MSSSDDDDGTVASRVSDYRFFVDEVQPVSFAELPIEWNKGEAPGAKNKPIFLRGTTDNGLRKIYKQVTAWRFELSHEKPKISVLSKDGHQFILLKPRKSFMMYIRTILITVQLLHFVKRNPQKLLEALWDHLSKVLSMFEPRPLVDDLFDHIYLITEAVRRDETLTRSKHLVAFLEENLRKRKSFIKDNTGYTPESCSVVKDDVIVKNKEESDENGESGDEESKEDDVCAICDNGGRLLICEGRCMRSFHPTVEDGADSSCPSLGYTDAEYEAIERVDFYCKNCKHKQHQCFACGNLGSSDELSGAEVLRCGNRSCGHFYHPHCVAKYLHPGNGTATEDHQKRITGGEQFACPHHICHKCKGLELNAVHDLQFAICRRCPRAYHRKCLPRKIAFEKDVDEGRGIVQRAWEGLIPNNRILIYCLKHDIDIETSTPLRNHIKFPKPESVKSPGGQKVDDGKDKTQKVKPIVQRTDEPLSLDADTKKRILTLMKNASSAISLEKMKEKLKVIPTHTQSSKFYADCTLGMMEGSVESVHVALQKLEDGGSFNDAKSFCGTDLLIQVMKWKMVDKLHWYVQDGDMIVDICSSTNDFICLMKKKLSGVGKSCSIKNYDVLQPKNDSKFERNDYMEVRSDELVEGSRLIMMLNPSSGVDSNLDHECINRTLELKPKLLIVISPRETKRLDEKDFPYDLIWEDDQMFTDNLSGEPIEDGNRNTLILYLWSCPDLISKHKAIAEEHGHLSRTQRNSKSEGSGLEMDVSDYTQECQNTDNHPEYKQETPKRGATMNSNHDEVLTNDNNSTERCMNPVCGNNQSGAHSNELSGRKRKRSSDIMLLEENNSNSTDKHSASYHTSTKRILDRSVDNDSSKHLERYNQLSHTMPDTAGPNESVPRSRFRVRPLGFALGPCLPYSQENSAGWLEE